MNDGRTDNQHTNEPRSRLPESQSATPQTDTPTTRLETVQSAWPDAPTQRITAIPPVAADVDTAPRQPVASVRGPMQPLRPATRGKGQRVLPPWRVWLQENQTLALTGAALFALIILGGGTYAIAAALEAKSAAVATKYCAALTTDNAKSGYALLTPSQQRQTAFTQFAGDASARDTISGKVTSCTATLAGSTNTLAFLANPQSAPFTVTVKRAGGLRLQGTLTLARDANGWHVAGVAASLAGIDLGPLHTEQAFCQDFANHNYDGAYALLSKPYQTEQGRESAFTQVFGSNLAITGCEPMLEGYTVDKADQNSHFLTTLDVTANDGSSTTHLTLPANITFVRDSAGWRIDSITPTLNQ